MRNLLPEDILPFLIKYLKEIGYQKSANKLQKKANIDLESLNSFQSKKTLQMIFKYYIKNHKKILKLFQDDSNAEEQVEEEVEEEEQETQPKKQQQKLQKKPNIQTAQNNTQKVQKAGVTNKNTKNIKTEEVEEEEEDEESSEKGKQIKITNNNILGQKRKAEVATPSSQPATQKKVLLTATNTNNVKNKQVENIEEEEQEDSQENQENEQKKKFVKNENFQKVDHSRMNQLKTELKDNTFQSKFKFGAGDEFGLIGDEKLRDVRGRNFKKEKGKLKNKGFQGGGMSINTARVNSIKL